MVSKKRFNSILFAFILHGAMFQPELSRYLEECSSTLATTYSSGTPGQDASIVTVDQVLSLKVILMMIESPCHVSAQGPIR